MDLQKNLPSGRAKLAAVINGAGDVIFIADVADTLDLTRSEAAKALSRWQAQGWLQRVGKGAYVPVQLEFLTTRQVVEDAWILVTALFDPAYIGGRTAAEHWDLTEQIFKDIFVFTAQPVRRKTKQTGGVEFSLKHVSEENIFGTKTVWRDRSKVAVSDPHRTIIDMLDDPAIGGGIQHVSECFARYLQKPERNLERLIVYADRLGNGAVFKRLGFLAENFVDAGPLIQPCKQRFTKGHAKLDPTLDCPRLVTRWRLRVPESWTSGTRP